MVLLQNHRKSTDFLITLSADLASLTSDHANLAIADLSK